MGSKLKAIKYNCLQAQRKGLQQQYGFLGLISRLKLKYHLMYCKVCRNFLKDSLEIDQVMFDNAESMHQYPKYTLSEEEKKIMKNFFDDSKLPPNV